MYRSEHLKDPIRCSIVSNGSKALTNAIETVLKTLVSNNNVGDIKSKNGYMIDCNEYMDFKITGLICAERNYGRFEIQFILTNILEFKK